MILCNRSIGILMYSYNMNNGVCLLTNVPSLLTNFILKGAYFENTMLVEAKEGDELNYHIDATSTNTKYFTMLDIYAAKKDNRVSNLAVSTLS